MQARQSIHPLTTRTVMQTRWARLVVPFVSLVLVATACGGAAATPTAAPTAAPPTIAAPTAAAPTAAPTPTAAQATTAPATPPAATAAPSETAAVTTEPSGSTESAAPSVTPAPTISIVQPSNLPTGATLIRWYCCLGAGDAPVQFAAEKKVVDDFNTSHQDIQIALEVVPYALARDQLATEIASGNPPDIVGPVGFGGANAFGDQWLDLTQLIKDNKYDLSQYQSGAVDFYKIGSTQVAIPFAIYPSELYYQRGAFAEIGLQEPPHTYGEKYTVTGAAGTAAFGVAEGTQVDWNYDTVHTLAELLTVDKNGNDATQAAFDPTQISTWGFEPQRDDMRGLGAFWGAGALAGGADGKTVQIPAPWATAWKWFYDGLWKDHILMDYSSYQSTNINPQGYPFCSDKVAMAENFLWSTYCLGGAGDDWDIAAIPSSNGQTTAAFNADTFRIMKASKHPTEAFKVLAYLLSGDVANQLLQTYGAMPARPEQQQAFFDALSAGLQDANGNPIKLQKPIDWQVAKNGVQYADNPNFESPMPKYNESLDLINTYGTRWQTVGNLKMDDQITSLQSELQAIWNK